MKHLISSYVLAIILLVINHSCENPTSTEILPKITTTEVSHVTDASALSGGIIDSDAGYQISACGVCWSTSSNPTIADNFTQDSIISGGFVSEVSGLIPNTTYYLRAYATNKNGIAYGLEQTFTTKSLGLTTSEVTEITINSAQSGGVIEIDGDSSNIIVRGVCWSTAPNPTIQNYKTIDGEGIGEFNSTLTGLVVNTVYYVRSYVTNSGGTYYGNQVSFTTLSGNISLSTNPVTSMTDNTAVSGGNITDDGGAAITDRGVCWSTSTNPTISNFKTSDGIGSGIFTSSITGLTPGTTYCVRSYAINSVGVSYGNEVVFNITLVVDVINPYTGKIWMDRNLGASRVALDVADGAAFGDLYQWGRCTDGHEKRNSPTSSTLSDTNVPGHGKFIVADDSPYDWRSPQNNTLWQGVNGTNNPCPTGYRIPTDAEWNAEIYSWSSKSYIGAFDSPLKLTAGGCRIYTYSNYNVGSCGYYWSSTISNSYSSYLIFLNTNAGIGSGDGYRKRGHSIRCIKD